MGCGAREVPLAMPGEARPAGSNRQCSSADGVYGPSDSSLQGWLAHRFTWCNTNSGMFLCLVSGLLLVCHQACLTRRQPGIAPPPLLRCSRCTLLQPRVRGAGQVSTGRPPGAGSVVAAAAGSRSTELSVCGSCRRPSENGLALYLQQRGRLIDSNVTG